MAIDGPPAHSRNQLDHIGDWRPLESAAPIGTPGVGRLCFGFAVDG